MIPQDAYPILDEMLKHIRSLGGDGILDAVHMIATYACFGGFDMLSESERESDGAVVLAVKRYLDAHADVDNLFDYVSYRDAIWKMEEGGEVSDSMREWVERLYQAAGVVPSWGRDQSEEKPSDH